VLVLGAGFGGLEVATRLSEALGDDVDITLIDRTDAFVFGFSKLDGMFGMRSLDDVRLRYSRTAKPGGRSVGATAPRSDPDAKRITTDDGTYEADVIVIALGADLDVSATPGLARFGNEYYTEDGAERLRDVLPNFREGAAVVGVCGDTFKCP